MTLALPSYPRGAPVIETGESGMKGARGTIVVNGEGALRVWWETVCPTMVTSITHGTALDLSSDLGRSIARGWLGERVGLDVSGGVTWRRVEAEVGPDFYVLMDAAGEWVGFSDDVDDVTRRRFRAVPGIASLTDSTAALVAACLSLKENV